LSKNSFFNKKTSKNAKKCVSKKGFSLS
jgi:hypothetical protein